jgi:CubicO group peptidase (beta-lactamase class C family)
MLVRHGSVIAEGWWSPYAPEHPHLLFSLSKSVTSTAVGFAVNESYFSIDDPVLSFFPEQSLGKTDLWAQMRVQHLLSMTTGQLEDTWSFMVDRADGDWTQGFFNVPVVQPPGTHFVYNTGATYMLSAIVQKTTGMNLVEYLEPRLFQPLGIEQVSWKQSPQGISQGGIGLSLRTEDIACFGQLYLQKGMWQEEELLPAAWIEAATCVQIANAGHPNLDWAQGYGYQFWRCRHGAYRGDGVFGQYCIIMPEQDAVLAIIAGMDVFDMQQPLNLVWDLLLPAMRPDFDSIPENPAAQAALAAKLSSLNCPTAVGEAASPLAAGISGRTYAVEQNALQIERITFDFSEAGCTLTLESADDETRIACGYQRWQQNAATAWFSQPLLFDHSPIAASGAWIGDETYTMVLRLHETPFFHTLTCHFIGDELMIEAQINVSLESMQPLLFMAHLQPSK